MTKHTNLRYGGAAIAVVALCLFNGVAQAHHSFAMYDSSRTVTFTGVVTRFVPQANHAELHFVPLGPDGKPIRNENGQPVVWGVEMAGAGAVATQGITTRSFPTGTIFSVNLNPLRDGRNFGSRTGPIIKCPTDTPPAAGRHCNSVQGSTTHGAGDFVE